MKILYVRIDLERGNGGYFVCERNLRALRKIAGTDGVDVVLIPRMTMRSVGLSLLRLGSYGVSRGLERRIADQAAAGGYDLVFLEGTLFGTLVRRLRKRGIAAVVFAHNVDSELYRQRYVSHRSLVTAMQYRFVLYNERLSVRHAAGLIVLNRRDAEGMERRFGRKADAILPITCPEVPQEGATKCFSRPYGLFVGSDFFPNVEGIKWFITQVAPRIAYDVRVVGSCCKNPALAGLPLPENVYMEGFVDDLSAYYRGAAFVVAPIFSGSGMKTKTVEAMSYGKTIVGTDEAFVGIDCDYARIGGLCRNADEFVCCIESLRIELRNPYTEELFNKEFTDLIFEQRLEDFLSTISKE